MNITKTDVEDYVATLDLAVKQIYYDVDNIKLGQKDLLENEAQIICEILNMFWRYTNKCVNEEIE
jgi:hypothetical protein